jgi:hypothetical protein
MSQHSVLFYATIHSTTVQAQSDIDDEYLMRTAGLYTHPGYAPSADDGETVESLVKEFGNMFDPEVRKQVFKSEVCIMHL